jgi:K+-transporting ATPase ATPase C chain
MMRQFTKELVPAFLMLLVLSVLCGLAYPFAMTGASRVLFPGRSRGSPIVEDGRLIGSRLIGQPFDDPRFFWGRPSATAPAYNGGASSGSNLGPTNPALREAVVARVAALRASDPENGAPIPVDLVTASSSGLDPHVSPAGALWQVPRVARARGLSEEKVRELVESKIEGRLLGVLGEPAVNVLELNLALEELR